MKRALVAVGLAATVMTACRADPGDQRTDTVTPQAIEQARADWPEGVAAQVDSGNAAFSAQDFDEALRHYRRATELGPQVTAAWFGIYMVEHARGNTAAADSAMQRARALSPGASLIHPDTTPPHP